MPWTTCEIEEVQCVTPDSLNEAHKRFDIVIIAYWESLIKRWKCAYLKLLFDTMEKTRRNRQVVIPESTFSYISYELEGAEELMTIKSLHLQFLRNGENDRFIRISMKD